MARGRTARVRSERERAARQRRRRTGLPVGSSKVWSTWSAGEQRRVGQRLLDRRSFVTGIGPPVVRRRRAGLAWRRAGHAWHRSDRDERTESASLVAASASDGGACQAVLGTRHPSIQASREPSSCGRPSRSTVRSELPGRSAQHGMGRPSLAGSTARRGVRSAGRSSDLAVGRPSPDQAPAPLGLEGVVPTCCAGGRGIPSALHTLAPVPVGCGGTERGRRCPFRHDRQR